jgi:putative ABC transport system substrate-binding protein
VKRREYIGLLGGATAWPLTAPAQRPAFPVIGFLRPGQPPKSWIEAFQQGLRELGYVDGQNVFVEFRSTDTVDQLPELVDKLMGLKVNVILASAGPTAQAAKKATTSVPIVFVGVIFPVEMGLVLSLGRPGGNITGLANNPVDFAGKRLELLRELVPKLRLIATLWDRTNPTNLLQFEGAEVAARELGMQLEPVPVRGPNDFESAFKGMSGDGLLVLDSPLFITHRTQLAELAVTSRVPTMYGFREMAEAGGLISYGAHYPDMYRRAATYVDKILKGSNAGDLPVELPTKFELVVNLKTTKALGLTVPPLLLARADEVIE